MHIEIIPVMLLLRVYLTNILAYLQNDICKSLLIESLFIIAKQWKQPKCIPLEDYINHSTSLQANTLQ